MSLRRALAAALLVPLALLSACTEDEPVPQMPDPTTVTPSPTETSSTAAPETAEEFIRRWQAAIDDMQTTGETAAFQAMNQDCQPCASLVDQVEAAYESGGTIESQGSVVQKVVAASSAGDTFDATVKFSRVRVTGADPATYPGGVQVFRIRVSGSGAELKVADYRVLAQ